jgi:hypothetical protein
MTPLKTKQGLVLALFSLLFLSAFAQETIADSMAIYPAEIVDTKPIYQGGESAIYQEIGKNLKFPIDARQRVGNIGSAYISFVIDENGHLDDKSIKFVLFLIEGTTKNAKTKRIVQESMLDNIELQCLKEAKRVIHFLKNWTPAQVGGKPVKCRKTLSVGFKNEGMIRR